ncbi:MAG: hypothetical protein HYU36_25755 [Planctomycetes bacterium]|nr:hypothetical protein [Planctomycetota bacterium]
MNKLLPILEVAAWVGIVLGYIFYLQNTREYYLNQISLAAIFVFILVSLFRRKPPMVELGFQMKTFGQATVSILPLIVLLAVLMVVVARMKGRAIDGGDVRSMVHTLIWYIPWGILQQFLLQSYMCVRIQNSVKDEFAAASFVGCFFGFAHLHLASPSMVLGATALGMCSSLHFIRHKNLLVLGIVHGVLAAMSLHTVPPRFIGGFLLETPFQKAFEDWFQKMVS